jgi:hypothetical protein
VPDPKLSVLVRVDLDGRHLRLVVSGALTQVNQQGLHPVINRARTLTPAAVVALDLRACAPLDPGAVELLRAGIEQQCRDRPGGTVELVLPEPAATTGQGPGPAVASSSGADRTTGAGRGSW